MRGGGGLPSGTVTFLFTDIELSTQTMEAMGNEAYADALDSHHMLLRVAFKAHGGHEVGTEGDAFFVAFERAQDAVDAAIDGQRALEGHPLRVRMGMHTGEALVRGGDYVGHDVHKAKRISDAGHGGQILLSQTTADLYGQAMLVDLGPHRLKDLGEPQRIFQLGAGDFPPLRSLETFRTNLPLLRSDFVGRTHEIAIVRRLLQSHRLVTLTGIGGCGKTRLAQQVGAELLDDYADGVFFAELGPVSDEALVPRAIGDGVGLPSGALAGTAGITIGEQLLGYLAQRACLILLDNCEHLLDACAEIIDKIQRRCPGVTILATSREVLGVDGEQAYGVPSLGLPDEDAVDSEAVSLFVSRAQTSTPGFEITPENAATIAEICRRLDGIPLAIEFAAARVTHLSPQQISQKLDNRFGLLTGGRRNVQRQQTLQAALDWSYDLLTEPERVLLRRLAVFPADFGLRAAEGICAGDDLDGSAVIDLVGSLVSKSLVLAEPAGAEVRYHLLETVRAYASERLTHAGEAEHMRDRHRDWHLAWLESNTWEESMMAALGEALLIELPNLRASMEWSQARGQTDLLCRMIARSGPYGWALFADGRRWAEAVRDADEGLDPDVRAVCLLGQGFDAQMDFDTVRGHELVDRSVTVARQAHPVVLAMALSERGWFAAVLAAWARDPERIAAARRDFEEALALLSDRWPPLSGQVLTRYAEVDMMVGDAPAAAVKLREAVDRLEDGRSSFSLGYSKVFLSAAMHVIGDVTGAAEILASHPLRPGSVYVDGAIGSRRLGPISVSPPRGLEAAARELAASGLDGTAAAVLGGGDTEAGKAALLASHRDAARSPFPGVVEEWVGGAAAVLAQCGQNERASRLLGWVGSVTYETPGTSGLRTPAAHLLYSHYVARVREALDPDVARRCREEGRHLSRDEAIAHALEGLDD